MYPSEGIYGVEFFYEEGDEVRVTCVDLYGFNGREEHPNGLEVGMEGVVLNVVATGDEINGEDDEAYYECYEVQLADGNILHFMDFELEPA